MALLGTMVNGIAIMVGALLGIVFQRIPDHMKSSIIQGLGLAIFVIGASMALKAGSDIFWIIVSLVLGAIVGELLNIEGKLESVGKYAEKKLRKLGKGKVAEAFVFSSLIYCVGAMAIVGALESGLNQNHSILYTKSILDGFTAIIFSSTMGLGVALSAVPVIIYEGVIALSAGWLRDVLQEPVINMMSATGGILIMGIALNVLEIKRINVGNLLPSIFIAGIIKCFF